MRRTQGAVVAFYLTLSVLWTWPWAWPGDTLPTRQFDLYGVVWVLAHATDLLDLNVSASEWPHGEDVTRLDTWVLAAFGLVRAAVGLDPILATRLLVVLGPAVSGLAAESCARRLGVDRPWSLIAGMIYGYSGLGATALLEGHVYALWVPWLPLLVRDLWYATAPGGSGAVAARAGAWWALALCTSAYTGLAASVLAVAVLARGAWARGAGIRPILAAFGAVVLPIGLAYSWLFTQGQGSQASDPATVLQGGSATLASLATWSFDIDLQNHSIAAPLGFGALALFTFAPVVLRAHNGWRTLFAVAITGVVLALGPAIQVGMGGLGTAHWLDLQGSSSWLAFLHFPVRALCLWYLCAGLVAARVAQSLARSRWVLVGIVAADTFVTSGFALRTGHIPFSPPSAYARAHGPVLELIPEDVFPGSGVELGARRLVCLYQVQHGQPVLGRCLGPHGATRNSVQERELLQLLLDGHDASSALDALGARSIVVHLDLFRPGDRALILARLEALLGPPFISTDGGETLALFGR